MTPISLHLNGSAFTLRRDGRKVGTLTALTPSLWIAALDSPPVVLHGGSVQEIRDKLRLGKY